MKSRKQSPLQRRVISPVPVGSIQRTARAINAKLLSSKHLVRPNSPYIAAKSFVNVRCLDCGFVGRVTHRMLLAGNKDCRCKHYSLRDLSATTSTARELVTRFAKIGLKNEIALKNFDSRFERQMRHRYPELIALGFSVRRKQKWKGLDLKAIEQAILKKLLVGVRLGDLQYVMHLYTQRGGDRNKLLKRARYKGYKKTHSSDREPMALANEFLRRFIADRSYNFRRFQQDHSPASGLYLTRTRCGRPLTLIIAEYVRKKLARDRGVVRFRLPLSWIREDDSRRYKRLLMTCRIVLKRMREERKHSVETASLLWGGADMNIRNELALFCKEAVAGGDREFLGRVAKGCSKRTWLSLSVSAKRERALEYVYRAIGIPKIVRDHDKRQTTFREVIEFARENRIETREELRRRDFGYYKWLNKHALMNEATKELGWRGHYWAPIAKMCTRSSYEAVVANILKIYKFNFDYDKRYPLNSGKRYRYDFRIERPGASSLFVEVWRFMFGRRRGRKVLFDYLNKRKAKVRALKGANLFARLIELEAEPAYRGYPRHQGDTLVEFGRRVCGVLQSEGVVDEKLRPDQLETAAKIRHFHVDEQTEYGKLVNYLVEKGAAAKVAREMASAVGVVVRDGLSLPKLIRGMAAGKVKAISERELSHISWDRLQRAFYFRQMRSHKREYYRQSEHQHGHWVRALLEVLSYRNAKNWPCYSTRYS